MLTGVEVKEVAYVHKFCSRMNFELLVYYLETPTFVVNNLLVTAKFYCKETLWLQLCMFYCVEIQILKSYHNLNFILSVLNNYSSRKPALWVVFKSATFSNKHCFV